MANHRRRRALNRNRLTIIVFMGLVTVALLQWQQLPSQAQWYGLAVFGLLSFKLAASTRNRPPALTGAQRERVNNLTIAAIIPARNEDPETLRRSLQSLLEQTRPVNAIVLVDDASSGTDCADVAAEFGARFAAAGVDFRTVRFDTNQGKRHAIAEAPANFPTADIYLGVDSDTVLHRDAVHQGMLPFADPKVRGVTGLVLALNATRNVLTRLIDLRYANAFLYERAAYSSLGSVLCACGSLAFYWGDTVRASMGDFLSQTFLGQPATYGDDRRMTNYCLTAGKVVFTPAAVAWTLVPEKMGHYLRQQIRWNKSFFRESLWVLGNMPTRKAATWLTAVELTGWLVFTASLLWMLAVQPFLTGLGSWGGYVAFICLLSYLRSVRYLDMTGAHGRPFRQRLAGFALAPLYGLLHLFVLLPLRVWSLLTLRDNGWGTRQQVEVSVAATVPAGLIPAPRVPEPVPVVYRSSNAEIV